MCFTTAEAHCLWSVICLWCLLMQSVASIGLLLTRSSSNSIYRLQIKTRTLGAIIVENNNQNCCALLFEGERLGICDGNSMCVYILKYHKQTNDLIGEPHYWHSKSLKVIRPNQQAFPREARRWHALMRKLMDKISQPVFISIYLSY